MKNNIFVLLWKKVLHNSRILDEMCKDPGDQARDRFVTHELKWGKRYIYFGLVSDSSRSVRIFCTAMPGT